MKKIVLFLLLVAAGATAAFGQYWEIPDDQTPRKIDKAAILTRDFYRYRKCFIVRYRGFVANPADGPIKEFNPARQMKLESRYPRLSTKFSNGSERNSSEEVGELLKYIITSGSQTVEILASVDSDRFFEGSKVRLFIIRPNSKVEFNFKKGARIPTRAWDQTGTTESTGELGFVLLHGQIDEDKDFAKASTFDDVMRSYADVPYKKLENWVNEKRKSKKSDDDLAQSVIDLFTAESAALNAISAAMPIWMCPAEFAVDLAQNMLKAQMAYAVSVCYKNKPETLHIDFKRHLYVLFANADVKVTLREMMAEAVKSKAQSAIGYEEQTGTELILDIADSLLTEEAVWEAIGKTGAVKFISSKLPQKVATKFTATGLAKAAGPVIAAIGGAILGAQEAKEFGASAIQFYKPAPKVKVRFDSGGGVPTPAERTLTVGAFYDAMPRVTKSGYTFNGWHTQASGGTKTLVGPSSTVNNKNDHMLYARWSPVAETGFKVSFNSNGGRTPSFSDKMVNVGYKYGPLPKTDPNGNSVFLGWYTQISGGTEVTENTVFTLAKPQTLYAHWEPVKPGFKVTFNSNTGSQPSFADKMVSTGRPYGDLPSTYKSGCTFLGWYSLNREKITPATVFNQSEPQTLYAQWSVKVAFDPQGGSADGPAIREFVLGSNYALPNVTKAGYALDGWYTGPSGGAKITTAIKVTTPGDHKLYARWEPVKSAAPAPNSPGGGTGMAPTVDKLKLGALLTWAYPPKYGRSTGKMQLIDAANKTISGTVVLPGTYNGNPVEAKDFAYCTNITSFVMLEGAISISNDAFTGCTGLTSFTIPASLNNFDGDGFPGDLVAKWKAYGAGTYTRPAGGRTWTKVGGPAPAPNSPGGGTGMAPTMDKLKWQSVLQVGVGGYYGSSTGKMQLVDAADKTISGTVVIPGTYNGNPVEAKDFANCPNITSFVMLEGAISISNYAFTGCTGLTSFTIPASLNVFGDGGFPGDLRAKWKANGAGTYTRAPGGSTWTKVGGR